MLWGCLRGVDPQGRWSGGRGMHRDTLSPCTAHCPAVGPASWAVHRRGAGQHAGGSSGKGLLEAAPEASLGPVHVWSHWLPLTVTTWLRQLF